MPAIRSTLVATMRPRTRPIDAFCFWRMRNKAFQFVADAFFFKRSARSCFGCQYRKVAKQWRFHRRGSLANRRSLCDRFCRPARLSNGDTYCKICSIISSGSISKDTWAGCQPVPCSVIWYDGTRPGDAHRISRERRSGETLYTDICQPPQRKCRHRQVSRARAPCIGCQKFCQNMQWRCSVTEVGSELISRKRAAIS